MPLPQFNQHQLLPDGIHPADQAALAERCVDPFAASATRRPVFQGLQQYQAALGALGLHVTQWVNGSFVDASRMDPEDVDLVNYGHAHALNALDGTARINAAQLLDGRESTKGAYRCHTFLVVVFPDGHPWQAHAERMRQYWREFFARARDYRRADKPHAPWRGRKGLAEMHVGDATFCPVLSHDH